MPTYRLGAPCYSCSGCHAGEECLATHEGGCGIRGGEAYVHVRRTSPELREGSREFDEACTAFLNQQKG